MNLSVRAGQTRLVSLEERVQNLLEKNRAEGLSADEEREWERYEYLEHLVRMAKAKAKLKLRGA